MSSSRAPRGIATGPDLTGDRDSAEFPFRRVFEAAPDALLITDAEGRIVLTNVRFDELFGYPHGELSGRAVETLMPERYRAGHREFREGFMRDPRPRPMGEPRELFGLRADGSEFPVEISLSPLEDQAGMFVMCAIRDMGERRRIEASVARLAAIVESTDDAIYSTTPDGVVTGWNVAAERMYGYGADEVTGRHVALLAPGEEQRSEQETALREVAEQGSPRSYESIRRCKDGRVIDVAVTVSPISDRQGRLVGVSTIARDVSAHNLLMRELAEARDFLDAVARNMGEGLLTIDASGKITYANRMASRMLGYAERELVGSRLTRLLDLDSRTWEKLMPDEGPERCDTESLVCGDGSILPVVMTSAPLNAAGANQWAIVIADDTERRTTLARLERELEALGWVERIQDALREEALVLYAQPLVEIGSGEVVQHELLLRASAPDGSIIEPSDFLPIAEEHGLITDLDRWVIREGIELACRGHRVAINVSAATLSNRKVPGWIRERIRRSGVDPRLLTFEITETALLRDETAARRLAKRLAALGCAIALDDFGTGYGGFTYLKQFEVAALKIDMEFVQDLAGSPASRNVVEAVISLARAFGLRTVGEGVEDAATLAILAELGVDVAQGFHMGRPAPVEAIFERTKENSA